MKPCIYRLRAILFQLALSLCLGGAMGCHSTSADTPTVKADSPTVLKSATGLASYYKRSAQGDETASGEAFNNNEMMAAHPSYPLGTRVRVTNLENGKSVEVRIADRGPSADNKEEGVIIDLSRAAAHQLGMMEDGRVKVRVDVLQWGDNERK